MVEFSRMIRYSQIIAAKNQNPIGWQKRFMQPVIIPELAGGPYDGVVK
jgi:hypothetical protein